MADTVPDAQQFETEVAAHRRFLFKLAMVQLQDAAAAEDVVQETILAALIGRAKFKHRSSIKTWLIAIMRHKVLDAIKSRRRYVLAPQALGNDEYDVAVFDSLFDTNGCWGHAKDAWTNPQSAAEQAAFLKVLDDCLTRLPQRTSRAFLMREWMDMQPSEIQSLLNVSPENLRVLLYRARMKLRLCLDLNWER